MNAHAKLIDGTVVLEEINSPGLGEDTVTLDNYTETGLRAVVLDSGGSGYIEVFRGDTVIGTFRLVSDTNSDWSVYDSSVNPYGVVESHRIVKGPDRLRALGTLLAKFS